ncbi:MAG: dihydrodipicolinate synthase family protein [Rhodospirillales bacterium]|nr:dihydrodipicolinate synthase family protein [Rhodospirillales bacterium]
MTDPFGPRGIVPSLNTPFAADGGVDVEGLERVTDYIVGAGCAGILVLAVAGETASLSPDEKRLILESVTRSNAGRIPIIVGASSEDWSQSIALAKLAREAGAFAVLWQAPSGSDEALLKSRLGQLGDAGPGVVVLQDLEWNGPGLSVDVIARLFEQVPAFNAIKVETVPAGPKYSAIMKATGGALHVSGGWAVSQMMDALERGVHAFMPTGMEPAYCQIHQLFAEGQNNEARRLFEELQPILAFANQHIDVSIRFFKALRRAAKLFNTDDCRAPVMPLDSIQAAEAKRLVERALKIESRLTRPA